MKGVRKLKSSIAKAIEHAYSQGVEPTIISRILIESVIMALPPNVSAVYEMGQMHKGESLWNYWFVCEKRKSHEKT